MSDEKLRQLYIQAESSLNRARNELYKPLDDVVNYSACTFSRSALYQFLSCLYILHSGDATDEVTSDKPDYMRRSVEDGTKTMDELIAYVGKHVPEVKKLDFEPVRCTHNNIKDVLNDDEIYFCNDTIQIYTCTDLAEKIKGLVLEKAFGGIQPGINPS